MQLKRIKNWLGSMGRYWTGKQWYEGFQNRFPCGQELLGTRDINVKINSSDEANIFLIDQEKVITVEEGGIVAIKKEIWFWKGYLNLINRLGNRTPLICNRDLRRRPFYLILLTLTALGVQETYKMDYLKDEGEKFVIFNSKTCLHSSGWKTSLS